VNWEVTIIGLIVGILVGMTGVGGASLLTPVLIFIGIQPQIAIGTDFFYNVITKGTSAIQHIKQKSFNLELVKYTAYGSIPAAVITNTLFYFFLKDLFNEQLILMTIGLILVSTSALTFFQMAFGIRSNRWKEKSMKDKKGLAILMGTIIGVVVGLTSIGGGSLFAIFVLYLFHIKTSELVGSDIIHAFFLTLFTSILMAGFGHINYLLAINLLVGSIPGSILGSKLSIRLPSTFIRIIILIIILISGLKLLL
jgi:uncharacterized protein